MNFTFDVAIVGLGINGLCTAYHLSKNKNLKILLLEQFQVGHTHGSSHSAIRIIRSTYKDPLYAALTIQAINKHWPQLEKTLKHKFINSNPMLVFGQYEPVFQDFKNSALTKQFQNFKIISGKQAQLRFPELKLDQYKQVIEDTKAGVIEAQNTIKQIYNHLKTLTNITIKTNTKVLKIKNENQKIKLQLQNQMITSKKLVVTAGKWIQQLIPQLSHYLTVNQQLISFLEFEGPKQNFEIGKFPVWLSFDQTRQYYGLPSFGSDGVKFARHINSSQNNKLNQNQKLNQIHQLSKVFTRPYKKIQKTQKCYYTSTQNQDFIIDFIDDKRNILIGSICSGHGFKFGPISGFILSELIQKGQTSCEIFQKNIDKFSIAYQKQLKSKGNL